MIDNEGRSVIMKNVSASELHEISMVFKISYIDYCKICKK